MKFTLMNSLNGSHLLRRYTTIAEAAREVLDIYAHTGVWYMIVPVIN